MTPITYDAFVQGVSELHLNLIATFVTGTRVRMQANDPAVPATRQAARDLYNYGLASRGAEGYERDASDVEWITWDVYINDTGRAYQNKLTVERIKLSRAPLPA